MRTVIISAIRPTRATAVGSDGAAVATVVGGTNYGRVAAVSCVFDKGSHASLAGTVTVSVADPITGLTQQIAVFTATGWAYPMTQAKDSAAALIAGVYREFMATGEAKVVIASSNAGNYADVRVYVY